MQISSIRPTWPERISLSTSSAHSRKKSGGKAMKNKKLATGNRLLHLHVSGERYGLHHYPHGPEIQEDVFFVSSDDRNRTDTGFPPFKSSPCIESLSNIRSRIPYAVRSAMVPAKLRHGSSFLAVASSSPFNRSCPQKKTAAQDEGSSKIGLTCGLLSHSPSMGRMVTCHPFFSYPHKEGA